jgi:hypothetical protein
MSAKKYNWNDVDLDFSNWDEEKIWALQLPVVEMDIKELLRHFDAPWWPNDNGDRWTITPWDVLHKTKGSLAEQKNIEKADLSYPIDILENKGKWLILDGIHRLTKAYKQGQNKIMVRIIPRARLPEILTDDPIELPDHQDKTPKALNG